MSNVEKTILIVEDGETLNKMLKYLFMSKGIKVESAVNGRDALELLKLGPPDLFIIDLMMPEMDGFELCEHLRSMDQYRQTPIIVLSALKEESNSRRLAGLSVAHYMEKPFSPADLVEKVSALL